MYYNIQCQLNRDQIKYEKIVTQNMKRSTYFNYDIRKLIEIRNIHIEVALLKNL